MDDHTNTSRWGKFSDSAEAELPEYRALSGLAVIGFVMGLLSALALVHVGLSFIGAASALCCVIALTRISAAPSEISGRRLAIAGLVLAVFWPAAGLAREVTKQRLLDFHSRKFAVHWFEYLRKGELEKAFELNASAAARRRLDDTLLDQLLTSQSDYRKLQEFVSKPAVLALITLGDRAQVRHYAFDGAGFDYVDQIYAVTYDDDGTKKSFLVRLSMERSSFPKTGLSGWRVLGARAPWKLDASS